MKTVFICSAYRGDVEGNVEKAREYCYWAATQCDAIPIAPHLYFPQFLEDGLDNERYLGIQMGLSFLKNCSELWYFGDAVSMGMKQEIDEACRLGIPIRHIQISDMQYGQNGGITL